MKILEDNNHGGYMKFFIILFVGLLLTTNIFAASSRTVNADFITTGAFTLTVPGVTDTFTSGTNTQTLTNKSLSGSDNTFTLLPDGALSTSYIKADGSRALTGSWNAGAFSGTFNSVVIGGTANGISAVGSLTSNSSNPSSTGVLRLSNTDSLSFRDSGNSADFALKPDANGFLQYNSIDLVNLSGTQTLTNKSLSGSSNTFTNIPSGTALSGQVPVANGGTNLATLTANNVILGNGTSNPLFVAPGSSGNLLTSNGTTWTSTTAPITAPTINNSQSSPQSVTAAGGIVLSAPTYVNYVFVVSNSGAVTITATPSITACTSAGQQLFVIGESATNTLVLQDESTLVGAKLRLNGNYVTGLNTQIQFSCDGNGFWIEVSRQ
jgi:hypothetical protein